MNMDEARAVVALIRRQAGGVRDVPGRGPWPCFPYGDARWQCYAIVGAGEQRFNNDEDLALWLATGRRA